MKLSSRKMGCLGILRACWACSKIVLPTLCKGTIFLHFDLITNSSFFIFHFQPFYLSSFVSESINQCTSKMILTLFCPFLPYQYSSNINGSYSALTYYIEYLASQSQDSQDDNPKNSSSKTKQIALKRRTDTLMSKIRLPSLHKKGWLALRKRLHQGEYNAGKRKRFGC